MQATLDVNISGEDTNDFGEKFNKMTTSIQTVKAQMDVMKQTIKELEKMVKMEQKKNSKSQQKLVKEKSVKKKPSGFAAPTILSDALCDFLSLDKATKMPRTDITQKLHEYIKTNNLQDPNNRKIIKPNEDLKKLLNIDDTIELTYFNLQKYMNHHFNKIEIDLHQ